MSVRKHRGEGGAKKPLNEESKQAHPGPFSFDDTRALEEARSNTTDEEAGQPGKRSRQQKLLERKQKKARKEDAKAIKHMRRKLMRSSGTSEWEKIVGKKHGASTRNGVFTTEEPERRVREKGERPRTHSKLSISGFERKQMALSLGDLGPPVLANGEPSLGEEGRKMSEVEPAQVAPYARGGGGVML